MDKLVQNQHIRWVKTALRVAGWIIATVIVIPITAFISSSILPISFFPGGVIIGVIVMYIFYHIVTEEFV